MRVKYPAKLPTSLVGWVIGGLKRRLALADIAHPHGGRHYRTSRDSPATHSYHDRRGRHETRPGHASTVRMPRSKGFMESSPHSPRTSSAIG